MWIIIKEMWNNTRQNISTPINNSLPLLTNAVYNADSNSNFINTTDLPIPRDTPTYSGMSLNSVDQQNLSSQSIPIAHYPNVVSITPRYATRPLFPPFNSVNENYSHNMPNTPIASNFTTPSTMTPLFPSNESIH